LIDDEMDKEMKRKARQLVELAHKPDPSLSRIEYVTDGKPAAKRVLSDAERREIEEEKSQ
jgi:hypothetical protein